MKKMMVLLSFAISACASADQSRHVSSAEAEAKMTTKSSHIRFWRGFKQDDLTLEQFQQNLIQKLIPATIQVGQNKGLISYAPVFPKNLFAANEQANFIPDEVAFIQYANEETYKKLAGTPEFKDYGKMHYEPGAFVKKNAEGFSSGSLVSKTISEKETILFNAEAFAVDFGQTSSTWQADDMQFQALVFDNLQKSKQLCAENLTNDLIEKTKQKVIKGFALLYDLNYILLYIKAEKGANQATLSFQLDSCFKIKKSMLVPGNRTQMEKGDMGLNFRL